MGSTSQKETTLHDILDKLETVHKKDIRDFASGHLNESRLWRPKITFDTKTWDSAHNPQVIPYANGSTPHLEKMPAYVEDMSAALADYVNGTGKPLPKRSSRPKSAGKSTSKKLGAIKVLTEDEKVHSRDWREDRITPNTEYSMEMVTPAPDFEDHGERLGSGQSLHGRVLVEEANPVEFSVPLPNYPVRAITREELPRPNGRKLEAIKMPFAEGSRRDQYRKMKKFHNEIVRDHDTKVTNLMSGMQAVEHLEFKLRISLEQLDKPTYGPNFHRLQIYSGIFDDLIQDSPIFGALLTDIKGQYDKYVSFLLDQPPAQTSLLAAQLDQLHRTGSAQAESLQYQQDRLCDLERIAEEELELRKKRRAQLMIAQENLDRILEESPQSAARRKRDENEKDEDKTEVKKKETVGEKCEILKTRIWEKLDELSTLRKEVHDKCVPAAVCAHLEHCNHDTEVEVQKLEKQGEFMIQANLDLEKELKEILESWDVSDGDKRRIWKSVSSTSAQEEAGSDIEDEYKWNWYIS